MPLLDAYLDQISASAKSIAELEFPPPKIFTNALLGNHEITTLIRDTEPHERALFSLNPELMGGNSRGAAFNSIPFGDTNDHGRKSIYPTSAPVKQSLVARLLGNDMLHEIRKSSGNVNRSRGGVDVEVLLRGAERLNEVYNVAGASDKVVAIRSRHQQITRSVSTYEQRVQQLEVKLKRSNNGSDFTILNGKPSAATEIDHQDTTSKHTQDDLDREEAEIRELEMRKKALEERVSEMEKDLGGLLG